jgi:hypothetical protein
MSFRQTILDYISAQRGVTFVGGYVRDEIIRGERCVTDIDVFYHAPLRLAKSLELEFPGMETELKGCHVVLRHAEGVVLDIMSPFIFNDLSCNCVGFYQGSLVPIPNLGSVLLEEALDHIRNKQFRVLSVMGKGRAREFVRRGWTCLGPAHFLPRLIQS